MFIVSDVLSLLPSSSSDVAPPPQVGQPAPIDPKGRISWPLSPARSIVLVFPRHVGCPFAERDVTRLVHLVLADPSRFVLSPASEDGTAPARKLQFLIAPHSDVSSAREWFASVLHAAYSSYKPADGAAGELPDADLIQDHFALFPDGADRQLAKAFGVGTLASFGSLFAGSMFEAVRKLKTEGIVNRRTGSGSDRWAKHGAVAVDAEGTVRWAWVAEKAEEEGDWEACVASLGL